jgi:hypothetical protein
VDAQNETGALRLYESMGFRAVFTETEWRRPLVAEPGTSLPDRPGAAVATTPEAGR